MGRGLLSVIVASWVAAAAPAAATTMLHHPLAELVQEAERVFVGVCAAVRDGELAQAGGRAIPYTEYTFDVREVLKGSLGPRVTIRQFGARQPRPATGGRLAMVTRVPAMPTFEVGQELLLFLVGDSSLGLTSPVGLGQGAFRIGDEAGRRVAVNAFDNAGLFRGMSPAAAAGPALRAEEAALYTAGKGPVALDPLLSLVRRLLP